MNKLSIKVVSIALAILMVITWSVVIILYFAIDGQTVNYATYHVLNDNQGHVLKQPFVRETSTDNIETENRAFADRHSPLQNVELPVHDDHTVSIDDILSALDINTE
ncbi:MULTISPECIES: hypothetical protein [Gracilibacillus]|uniref:hypothetical protein n=1 Tax=Gracilibacillus TaxID=74385 RepID=UPI001030B4CA|nr:MULTISPECIES: hypothetical protein [Gracilibacillus]